MAPSRVSSSSTEEEENLPESGKKANSSGHKRCYMHIASVKHEKSQDFTIAHWDNYRNSLRRWLELRGKLQKAAELKDDHSILIHIKDKDCVALEVQYHKSCYLQYTRFLSEPARPEKEPNEPTFDISYKIFCERIIRQRLLVNQEVLRMGQLSKTFIELVKTSEGLDASNYRQDTLKRRLCRDFPQLVFHTPTKHNISELVFAETLSTETLLDMLP